jgi:anthranilate/para-aminobenzoate synthase component II
MHSYGIYRSKYEESESFKSFYRLLTTDTINGLEFLTAFEAYDYPIYGWTFHPEFALLKFLDHNQLNVVRT